MVNAMLDLVLERQKAALRRDAWQLWRRLFSIPRVLEHARDNQRSAPRRTRSSTRRTPSGFCVPARHRRRPTPSRC